MIRSLLGSRRDNRLAHPVLEALESREAPTGSVGAVTAAIQDAAIQIQTLKLSVATGNFANANATLLTVYNDFGTLQSNTGGLDTGSRIQVDNALISNGVTLAQLGVSAYPQNPQFSFNLAIVGVNAVISGYLDEMITSQLGGASSVVL